MQQGQDNKVKRIVHHFGSLKVDTGAVTSFFMLLVLLIVVSCSGGDLDVSEGIGEISGMDGVNVFKRATVEAGQGEVLEYEPLSRPLMDFNAREELEIDYHLIGGEFPENDDMNIIIRHDHLMTLLKKSQNSEVVCMETPAGPFGIINTDLLSETQLEFFREDGSCGQGACVGPMWGLPLDWDRCAEGLHGVPVTLVTFQNE